MEIYYYYCVNILLELFSKYIYIYLYILYLLKINIDERKIKKKLIFFRFVPPILYYQ